MAHDNPLVGFLAAYGPSASSSNLFDEFVVKASADMGCAPLEIAQPLVDEIEGILRGAEPCSVILTGTAGDGKTYTARRVLERLGGTRWSNTDKVVDVTFDGRRVRFVKDLSELNDEDKDALFEELVDSLEARGGTDPFVVCVNDGHLLKLFRDRRDQLDGRADRLHRELREMLRSDATAGRSGTFRLFNMSRQPAGDMVEQVFDQVAGHPGWAECRGCPALDDKDRPCPIRVNLDLLRETGPITLRARIRDMVGMAAADGRHLSIRHLILLAVNILLGDQKTGSSLLSCAKAQSRAKRNEYALTNPFSNVFGANLSERQRRRYAAFAFLDEFGVGRETTNHFDRALLAEERRLPDHPVYGERIFSGTRASYRRAPLDHARELRAALVEQRRLAFFLSDPAGGQDPRANPWALTVYKHGGSYVRLVQALADGQAVDRRTQAGILGGLNRVMTGSMTGTSKALWLTEPSGVFRGRGAPLLVLEASPRGDPGVRIGLQRGQVPAVIIEMRPFELGGGRQEIGRLVLRPALFEFLMRVADGALPASFATECVQDVRRLQLTAVERYHRLLDHPSAPREVDTSEAELRARPITLMEEAW